MSQEPNRPHHHVAQMRDHFSSHPDWTPGRRYYAWFLTFEGHPEVHGLARIYQEHLGFPDLAIVPLEWLHLTLQGVGDLRDVTKDEVQRVATQAASECRTLAPSTVTLGPARVTAEAVMLDVTPHQPVTEVHEALRAAIADALGPTRVPSSARPFTPHISLAYSTDSQDSRVIVDAIESIRIPPITTSITAAELVTLCRDNLIYHWTVNKHVPLGGPTDEDNP